MVCVPNAEDPTGRAPLWVPVTIRTSFYSTPLQHYQPPPLSQVGRDGVGSAQSQMLGRILLSGQSSSPHALTKLYHHNHEFKQDVLK